MSISKVSRIVGALLALALAVPLAQPAVRQEKLTRKELKRPIASATTPADHERIAAYYRAEAQNLEAKQREHEEDLNTTKTRCDTRASTRRWVIIAEALPTITGWRLSEWPLSQRCTKN